MLIKISRRSEAGEYEVTDRSLFERRREFIQNSGRLALAGGLLSLGLTPEALAARGRRLEFKKNSAFDPGEKLSSYEDATSYNNFYEFSLEKRDPKRLAKNFKTEPWTVKVDGEVAKPGDYALEDLIKPHPLEERIYRFRCVEAWSMVVPWVGFPLADLIKRLQPTSRAKYVVFQTLYDPKQMPGQRRRVLDWPYVEGLRMDEAMHPLTLLAVGMYGEVLPNQNGAPLRLVVPWKYGFKNIKSIVRISFQETLPATSWALAGPSEYGFYANVNPRVDHPRWTQARERRLGEFLKRPTLMFNGYEEVAELYRGMDLRKYY